MTPDEAMQVLDQLLASFSTEERQTLGRELDRRLGHLMGKKIPPEMEDRVAKIIVEEIQMIRAARDA